MSESHTGKGQEDSAPPSHLLGSNGRSISSKELNLEHPSQSSSFPSSSSLSSSSPLKTSVSSVENQPRIQPTSSFLSQLPQQQSGKQPDSLAATVDTGTKSLPERTSIDSNRARSEESRATDGSDIIETSTSVEYKAQINNDKDSASIRDEKNEMAITGAHLAAGPTEMEMLGATSASEDSGGEAVVEMLSTGRKIIIVCALCMCTLVAAMDQSILTTALPAIAGNFDSASGYSWIGSAYLLMSAAFLPSWGKISDIFGRKPVLLTASGIFMIGSIICGASPNIAVLIFGRAVQGLGAGGSFGLVNLTISDIVAPRDRGFYLSFVGLTWTLASCLGPILGGAFTQEVSWRLCFWINLPIGGLAMIGLMIFLHLDSPKISVREGVKMIDWLGSFFCVSGTTLFLVSMELGGIYFSWRSPLVISCLVIGIACLAIFVWVERCYATHPIMPMRLFSTKHNIACYTVDLFHGIVFMGATYFLPLFFQSARAASPLMSGVYIFPFLVTSSVLSTATGWLTTKTGRVREWIWMGMFLLTLGCGLSFDLRRTSNWGKMILYQAITGAGTAPNFQSPLLAIQSTTPSSDLATATATYMFIRNIASALGVSLGLVVFQNAMAEQHKHLAHHLGTEAGSIISGEFASSSVDYIQDLPANQQDIARDAYSIGLADMWLFYLGCSAAGLIACAFIAKTTLSKKVESNQPAMRKKRKKVGGDPESSEGEAQETMQLKESGLEEDKASEKVTEGQLATVAAAAVPLEVK